MAKTPRLFPASPAKRYGFDRGAPYRQTEAEPVKRGYIFASEGSQKVIYDGAGNKTWFATASAADATITLPSADVAVGVLYTVKRVSGSANLLKVVALSGTLDGTPTYTIATQYDAFSFQSDGLNYYINRDFRPAGSAAVSNTLTVSIMSVLQTFTASGASGFLGSLRVSATASVGALHVDTTSSLSGAVNALTTFTASGAVGFLGSMRTSGSASVGFLHVGGTSSLSGAVNALTTFTASGAVGFLGSARVSGSASVGFLHVGGTTSLSGAVTCLTTLGVSGTLSAGELILDGRRIGGAILGTASGATNTHFGVSGTWTNVRQMQVVISGKGNAAATNFILNLYTDGGTTPILTYAAAANTSATASEAYAIFNVFGTNADSGLKFATVTQHFLGITTQATQGRTAVADTGSINAVYISMGAGTTTLTMSSAHFNVYGTLA